MARQHGHHLVHGHVLRRVVVCLSADDERCARFVNQDGVHLVNDGVVEATLHAVFGFVDHVVTQVVETKFVVGTVGDVCVVGRLLFFTRQLRQIDAHTHAQEVVELAHPLRITAGQVVVDRDHVHTFVGQCIQVHRQSGREGLAFTGAHFRNFAVVQ